MSAFARPPCLHASKVSTFVCSDIRAVRRTRKVYNGTGAPQLWPKFPADSLAPIEIGACSPCLACLARAGSRHIMCQHRTLPALLRFVQNQSDDPRPGGPSTIEGTSLLSAGRPSWSCASVAAAAGAMRWQEGRASHGHRLTIRHRSLGLRRQRQIVYPDKAEGTRASR